MRARPFEPRAFTLVEIVLALGVASVFLVGIVSLLSTGLASSQEAASDTRVSLIVRDVANRVRGKEMVPNPTLLGPLFYTDDGEWLDPEATTGTPAESAIFGVKARAVTPNPAPPHANVLAVIVDVYWPVAKGTDGPEIPATAQPKARFTYYATTAAGNGWSAIDPTFVPKIEF